VITTQGGLLAVWDLAGGKMLTNFHAHQGAAYLCGDAFSRGGRNLVTFGDDHLFKEWSTANWTENRRYPGASNVVAWTLSPGTDAAVVAFNNPEDKWVHFVDIINAAGKAERRRISGLIVQDVDVSPDGKILAVAEAHGRISLWYMETGGQMGVLRADGVTPWAVAFSPDGRRVAAARNGPEAIKLWDLGSREEVGTLEGEGSNFYQVKFSPDGRTLGAVNWRGKLHLWDAPSWDEIAAAESNP
jgi:WD40 repeat protein